MIKRTLIASAVAISFSASATFNILVDQKNNDYNIAPIWSNWVNTGSVHSCINQTPLASDIEKGILFNQTSTCQQDQEKTNGLEVKIQTITVSHQEDIYGTLVHKTCLEVKNAGHNTSGNYLINPTGSEEFEAYCDMTTDGGGWTLVFYSNSDNVLRNSISNSDWNINNSINFSRLHSFKDIEHGGRYEFFVHDSSTVFRHSIFKQDNAYNESPMSNNHTITGGNMYYSSQASEAVWHGLALGNFGNVDMTNNCSLAMSSHGGSWTYCLQDQLSGNYGTGPWFYDAVNVIGGYDSGSQNWVKVYQR